MDFGKEFRNYAVKHQGITSMYVDQFITSSIVGMTPNVIEERPMNIVAMDVFSRLMMDRIIFLGVPIYDQVANIVQAQLLFLESTDSSRDIQLYINSPGGSVMCGLGIVDLMNYVSSDVVTTNIGMCASMGSVLLSSGTKGKRSALVHSKVMTHFVSHGTKGNIQDTRIDQMEGEKYNYILFKILAENCGKTFDEMYETSRRDKWFNSDEALNFGLVDEVIGVDKNKTITNYLEGFDDYYKKEVLNYKK
jgi:ATP-dependent Clp protease protease subunit